ncbi:hypothetical protein StrepF001_41000 [Streptomyces sp. F001]|uniref:hypothetical protein n=1 Tax=Streptomyces sp. F001 TaxID=1510026 RepID=UPI00101E644C|nr:hypothetical protein [Streptomyces sp. F001]RZB14016.1 hypothetical protein StrepF001_41000 [Streptomyces sp. F001]
MMSVEDTAVTCADNLIEDASAWAALLPGDAGTQWGLDEVQALLEVFKNCSLRIDGLEARLRY